MREKKGRNFLIRDRNSDLCFIPFYDHRLVGGKTDRELLNRAVEFFDGNIELGHVLAFILFIAVGTPLVELGIENECPFLFVGSSKQRVGACFDILPAKFYITGKRDVRGLVGTESPYFAIRFESAEDIAAFLIGSS